MDNIGSDSFNDDIVVDTPTLVLPNIRRKCKQKKLLSKSLNKIFNNSSDQVFYNKDTIKTCPSNLHEDPKKTFVDLYHKKLLNYNFNSSFSKVHVFRTISEIINLQNEFYFYDNVRIIGLYNFNLLKNTDKIRHHFIKETNSENKLKLDLNLLDEFPLIGSHILVFASIQYEKVLNDNKFIHLPYLLVKFWQTYPKIGNYDCFNLEIQFRPKHFDLKIKETNFDETLNCTELYDTLCETDASLFLKQIEFHEAIYYEIEQLMKIDIDIFR